MSEGFLTLAGLIISGFFSALAVFLQIRGTEKMYELRLALSTAEIKIKQLEGQIATQAEVQKERDTASKAALEVVTTKVESEKALRLESDSANEAVIAGLQDKINLLTEQLAKAEKRNDTLAAELADVKKQSNERIVNLETQIRDLVQARTQNPIPTPTPAPATEAKET